MKVFNLSHELVFSVVMQWNCFIIGWSIERLNVDFKRGYYESGCHVFENYFGYGYVGYLDLNLVSCFHFDNWEVTLKSGEWVMVI